ncbi:GMP/IMP nucleotidase [Alishewanella sp. 16-MA]|uniref:GMP/IMP nucleotidase n=1 Tax=Alishewanella maricola TaxID=2795740 RepID=A0ABS8C4H9_9ALTE|nr:MULTISPECIES: GMP/IMP nucleotidase [Alishewanella]MDP4945593.1 GMP/IMP nucleotidase [Alishewanella sp.]MDP5206991.1 GMP/IMP nucleotidase [Alishewanella sp. SMS9]MCB5227243.1 GMP/IMP nucleotidase [Alishewanella maricola]MDP5035833.1 GMP/IMP nucleotidase [Alishewanella sp.]MDP5186945.1 GMP/IMP nucleotidase [Alishewanella sp.]
MLQWSEIDTVLLDMDGTLLDLHFDNYFWQQHLPLRWAEISGISPQQAAAELAEEYQRLQGKLEWYCLDYWGKRLQLPITELKREIINKIQMRADVPAFLTALKATGRHIVLVTNAHPDSLSLKLERTDLANYIEELISTHEFSVTKESQLLWQKLQQRLGFDVNRTLFVDDSLVILQAAEQFGIKHLLAVANPDSQKPHNNFSDYAAVTDYHQLLPAIYESRHQKFNE